MKSDDEQISVAEALRRDRDLHGGDESLALKVAEMTESERQQSRANLRSFAAELRATLHRVPPEDDAQTA